MPLGTAAEGDAESETSFNFRVSETPATLQGSSPSELRTHVRTQRPNVIFVDQAIKYER